MGERIGRDGKGLILQTVAAVSAFAALAWAPPAQGPMLLVPLTSTARRAIVPLALGHGAQLIAAGRWRASLIVEGRRARLLQPMLSAGILTFAATPPCAPERN